MIYDTFEKLDPRKHNRNDFSCGDEAFDRYLKKQARQDQDKGYSVTWVLQEADSSTDIVAFYTLSNSALQLQEFSTDEQKALKFTKNPTIPCTLMGRFAVNKDYQGQGIGKVVLYEALNKSLELSESGGSVFVVIDAKTIKVRNWYADIFGFVPLSKNSKRVYLPIKALKQLFNS